LSVAVFSGLVFSSVESFTGVSSFGVSVVSFGAVVSLFSFGASVGIFSCFSSVLGVSITSGTVALEL